MGAYSTKNIKDKLMTKFHVFNIVFSYCIESAVVTSDSMSARGYGLENRTNYHNFKWSIFDTIMIVFVVTLGSVVSVFMALGFNDFDYYPFVDVIKTNALSIVLYFSYFCLACMGLIMEIKEVVLWRILKSKI